MKEVRVSDGIVPLGEFKARASKLLKRIGETGQPMVITQNGRPAGVLLSPREYDRLQESPAVSRIDRRRIGGCRARKDVDHGRVAGTASRLAQRARREVKITWTEQAWKRLLEIEESIARDDPDAAARVVDLLIERGEQLAAHPERGRRLPELPRSGLRELIVGNYRVVYRRTRTAVEVLTVFEGHRLPRHEELTGDDSLAWPPPPGPSSTGRKRAGSALNGPRRHPPTDSRREERARSS